MGHLRRVLVGVIATLWACGSASAAELKVSFAELAAVVQAVIGDVKLHLHNAPGGFFNVTPTSFYAIAGKQTAIDLPVKSFELVGSTYGYYVNDLNATSVRVSAVPSAVRLTLTFESQGVDLVAGCIAGECLLANALPTIGWSNGSISIDVVPVRSGTSLALQARSVTVGGTISASCSNVTGFFSLGACDIALPWANQRLSSVTA